MLLYCDLFFCSSFNSSSLYCHFLQGYHGKSNRTRSNRTRRLVRSWELCHVGFEACDGGSGDQEPFYPVPFSSFGLVAAAE